MFGKLKISPRINGIKIRILERRERKTGHRYRKISTQSRLQTSRLQTIKPSLCQKDDIKK